MKTTKDKLNKKDIKKIFNSPTCKKWAKNMEKMYNEEYRNNILDYWKFASGIGLHKEIISKPIRVSGKKKGNKR